MSNCSHKPNNNTAFRTNRIFLYWKITRQLFLTPQNYTNTKQDYFPNSYALCTISDQDQMNNSFTLYRLENDREGPYQTLDKNTEINEHEIELKTTV